MKVSVIIAAAGMSRRIGGASSKVFLPLAGKPVLLHSIDFFSPLPEVREIIIAAPEADMAAIRHICSVCEKTVLVPGGSSRTLSVAKALAVTAGDISHIAVHDAARPLLSKSDWQTLLQALDSNPAALLAATPVDSIKRVGEDGLVAESMQREQLVAAQTPQIFEAQLLRDAYRKATAEGCQASDDVSLVERLGVKAACVLATEANWKLTYAEDFAAAEAVLAQRRQSRRP